MTVTRGLQLGTDRGRDRDRARPPGPARRQGADSLREILRDRRPGDLRRELRAPPHPARRADRRAQLLDFLDGKIDDLTVGDPDDRLAMTEALAAGSAATWSGRPADEPPEFRGVAPEGRRDRLARRRSPSPGEPIGPSWRRAGSPSTGDGSSRSWSGSNRRSDGWRTRSGSTSTGSPSGISADRRRKRPRPWRWPAPAAWPLAGQGADRHARR